LVPVEEDEEIRVIETVGKLFEKLECLAVKLQFANIEEAVAKFKTSHPEMTIGTDNDFVGVTKSGGNVKNLDSSKLILSIFKFELSFGIIE
jgi:hypothetical protein